MKKGIKYTGILLFIIGLFYFLYLFNWEGAIEKEVHYLPFPYVGPVLIYFDQKDGMQKERINGARLYRISSAGVLKTKFKANDGWIPNDSIVQLFYVDSLNNVVGRIPYSHLLTYDTIITKNYIGATQQVYHSSTINNESIVYLKYIVDTLNTIFEKYPNFSYGGPGIGLKDLK